MKLLRNCFSFVFLLSTLRHASASWLCQSPSHSKRGPTVTIGDDANSEGCIYKSYPIRDGNHYFEVTVENSDYDIDVGVSTEEALRENPFIGFFYGSDLTDGVKTLRDNFGDFIGLNGKYDTVGIIVKMTREEMKMYIIHSGVSLGLAYQAHNPPTTLYPAILVEGNGKVTFTKKEFNENLPLERSNHILEGIYELEEFKDGEKGQTAKCLDDKISITSLYFEKSENEDDDEDFVVSYNNGKQVGILSRNNGQWTFRKVKTYAARNGSQKSPCVTFVDGVLNTVQSVEKTDETIKVFGNGKSFEAKKVRKISPPPVMKNVFEDSNDSF